MSTHIILFYCYHPLTSDKDLIRLYKDALTNLCTSLSLTGRILIGCSDNGEGINGTLAGSLNTTRLFTLALLGETMFCDSSNQWDEEQRKILQSFWEQCRLFASRAHVPVLTMKSPDDFKWSKSEMPKTSLFPDLNIKVVDEMISTGGLFSKISINETGKGYLTPEEWHQEMEAFDTSDTILIDCRNTKECQIGRFPNAIDPNTTTFAQFPKWVQDNQEMLAEKNKVLMFCTGGIRCEKASAYVRQQVPGVKQVQHLKGGIHKYLEQYGSNGLWKGKNFVFDGRGTATGSETLLGKDPSTEQGNSLPLIQERNKEKDHEIVGICISCSSPYDTFHPNVVCTVCREPILVCMECQDRLFEFHCKDHHHLRKCYYSSLERFSREELQAQLTELQNIHLAAIAVGKRYKQRRKTLLKQIERIEDRLNIANVIPRVNDSDSVTVCRSCGDVDCSGACWGYHGLKRQLKIQEVASVSKDTVSSRGETKSKNRSRRVSGGQRHSKIQQRERSIKEIRELGLSTPPMIHRDVVTGVRTPPPCTRVIETLVKGKWCGKTATEVIRQEFPEAERNLSEMLKQGLLRVNGKPASSMKLKNLDVFGRIVHWHEPPVIVPPRIDVERFPIPPEICKDYSLFECSSDVDILLCNKPSTVPVHPAGPYLANTLTMMVEAQEGLDCRSLVPCHRIDRVTSGLTICTANIGISRLIQSRIDEGHVRKLYLAMVKGLFPSKGVDLVVDPSIVDVVNITSVDGRIDIDAPIHVINPATGLRGISSEGKQSQSRFKLLTYNEKDDTSLICCYPVTGRGHQLRVHLQTLDYPIIGDTQYGGPANTSENVDALHAITQTIRPAEVERRLSTLSIDEVELARAICPSCTSGNDGARESFTDAQLLLEGYSIALHALRYEIRVPVKKSKEADLWHPDVLLQVALPRWAESIDLNVIKWL